MADDTHLLFPDLLVDHLQDLVLKTEGVKEMLDELAEFSAVTLADPAIAFCSITLIQRKKPVTVASSEERAIRLDETQYISGDGPCLSAIRQQTVVHVPDLAHENRWPAYTGAALEAGVEVQPVRAAGPGRGSGSGPEPVLHPAPWLHR